MLRHISPPKALKYPYLIPMLLKNMIWLNVDITVIVAMVITGIALIMQEALITKYCRTRGMAEKMGENFTTVSANFNMWSFNLSHARYRKPSFLHPASTVAYSLASRTKNHNSKCQDIYLWSPGKKGSCKRKSRATKASNKQVWLSIG